MVRYTAFRKCDKGKDRKQFVVCSSVVCVIPLRVQKCWNHKRKNTQKGNASTISRIQD